MTTVAGARGKAFHAITTSTARHQRATASQPVPEMSHLLLTVPGMNKPPGRYDVTLRAASGDGHPLPDPAAFAAVARHAASSMNAGVISAHTAEAGSRHGGLRAPHVPLLLWLAS